MARRSQRHVYTSLIGAGLVGALTLVIASCSSPPPAEETAEDLTSITEEAETDEELEELNAELHPEFQVDPLDCDDVLVLTVRGTGEPSNKQLLSPVARLIEEARPGKVQVHDIDYPANGEMRESASRGERMLIDTLNQQHELCPNQKFVVMGYSQGALVLGETLIEPSERLVGAHVGEVRDDAADQIIAALMYADPRFVGSEPFAVGNFAPQLNGLLERPEGLLQEYEGRIRSYCVGHDFICQASTDLNEEGHVAYYSNGMQQDGAAFVITRLGEPVSDSESPEDSKKHVER